MNTNPLVQIRESCNRVVSQASHVAINDAALLTFADSISSEGIVALRKEVEWDSCGWHFSSDAAECGPLTCQYIFVLDSLNFCFWPTAGLEYDTLASRLRDVLLADAHAFDADRLSAVTPQILSSWFEGFDVPLLDQRVARLHELGEALLEDFDGLAANVVKRAQRSATRLVKILLAHFPGFRDTTVYKGQLVHLYKRVQILVGDVWAAYGRPLEPTHPYSFADIDQLTMFADYRIPQILRSFNALQYSSSLAASVDALQQIPFGSEEETEIRACTVIAVERLHQMLAARGLNLLVIEIDWLLWQQGEAAKDEILPHHRTLTIYY